MFLFWRGDQRLIVLFPSLVRDEESYWTSLKETERRRDDINTINSEDALNNEMKNMLDDVKYKSVFPPKHYFLTEQKKPELSNVKCHLKTHSRTKTV